MGRTKLVTNTMDALLADGFTKPWAHEYLDILAREDERGPEMCDPDYRKWCHDRGFFALQGYVYDLDESNVDDYMTDYDYHRIWPLNSWQRIWINDKMTLKYMLAGSELDEYMPKTYYYTKPQGGLLPLLNAPKSDNLDAFLGLLREVREFAVKPCNGARTVGFHKLGYSEGTYLIDNKEASADLVKQFVESHPNNIFTEFFHPSKQMAQISPVINNLRLLVFNEDGMHPQIGASYFRFAMGAGTDDSKSNYNSPSDPNAGNFNVWFDWKTGWFGKGAVLYANRVELAPTSPDTGASTEGVLEDWEDMIQMVLEMSERLGPLEYMGYDVCITDKGPKVIEINSHSGSKYVQYYQPFYKDDFMHGYFERKLAEIDSLCPEDKARRNNIMR